jgi:hypothetical protein
VAASAARVGQGGILGILALTHSSRETNLDRCSAAFLEQRFGDPERLERLPPFESLQPAEALYSGSVSFYRVTRDAAGRLHFESIGDIRDREKIQHVVLRGEDEILVGYEHRIECWRLRRPVHVLSRITRSDCSIRARFEHPHLAGLHTVMPLPGDRALLSCAGSDSVLVCDIGRGLVERSFRMPASLYGHNYALTSEMDLRRHYIHDGCQTTHLNAASVDREGRRAVVSALIQGAIGLFDLRTGDYQEIARGFVGCHGARFSDRDEIYLADSPRGCLIFLGPGGQVTRRFETGSLWLHDVQQIRETIYAFALADTNELRIYDIDSAALLVRRKFSVIPFADSAPVPKGAPDWLGNSTQALSYTPLHGTAIERSCASS